MINPTSKITAVRALYGRDSYDVCTADGEVTWKDGHETTAAEASAITAKYDELMLEWTAQEYARTRQPLYPDIGDQLDDLYKEGAFSASMTATLKKVKDDNPKG